SSHARTSFTPVGGRVHSTGRRRASASRAAVVAAPSRPGHWPFSLASHSPTTTIGRSADTFFTNSARYVTPPLFDGRPATDRLRAAIASVSEGPSTAKIGPSPVFQPSGTTRPRPLPMTASLQPSAYRRSTPTTRPLPSTSGIV